MVCGLMKMAMIEDTASIHHPIDDDIIILLFTAAARRHSLQVATRVREHATNNKQQKIIFSFFKDEAILIAKLTKRKSKAVRLAKAKSYKYVLYRGRH